MIVIFSKTPLKRILLIINEDSRFLNWLNLLISGTNILLCQTASYLLGVPESWVIQTCREDETWYGYDIIRVLRMDSQFTCSIAMCDIYQAPRGGHIFPDVAVSLAQGPGDYVYLVLDAFPLPHASPPPCRTDPLRAPRPRRWAPRARAPRHRDQPGGRWRRSCCAPSQTPLRHGGVHLDQQHVQKLAVGKPDRNMYLDMF